MASVAPSPKFQWIDDNGNPGEDFSLYTYESETTTPKTTYTDDSEATPNTNPIVLDSNGACDLHLEQGAYRLRLEDDKGNLVWQKDGITSENLGNTFVQNVAGLKAFTPSGSQSVYLLGYYTPGDGGGGQFYWNATSSASDDSGTIFIPDSLPAFGRWFRDYQGGVQAKWFGAKADGSTDDSSAIQAAVAITPPSIYFSEGTYIVDSRIDIADEIILIGDGASKSILKNDSLDDNILRFYNASRQDGMRISDLGFIHNGATSYAIKIDNFIYSNLEDLQIDCENLGYGCIHYDNDSFFSRAYRCSFERFSGKGVLIEGSGSERNFYECLFSSINDNIVGLETTQQGTKIYDGECGCQGTACIGIYFHNVDATGREGGLVDGMLFENFEADGKCILIDGDTNFWTGIRVQRVRGSLTNNLGTFVEFGRAAGCILDDPIWTTTGGGGEAVNFGENSSRCIYKVTNSFAAAPFTAHASSTTPLVIIMGSAPASQLSGYATSANANSYVESVSDWGYPAYWNGTKWYAVGLRAESPINNGNTDGILYQDANDELAVAADITYDSNVFTVMKEYTHGGQNGLMVRGNNTAGDQAFGGSIILGQALSNAAAAGAAIIGYQEGGDANKIGIIFACHLNASGVNPREEVARLNGITGSLELLYTIYVAERANATADKAGYGQFWVESLTPNKPRFTDDTGVDYKLVIGKYSTSNVSNPPTDAQLDAAFGDPSTLGPGFYGVLDDADGGADVYLCWTTGNDGEWFYVAGTKAV